MSVQNDTGIKTPSEGGAMDQGTGPSISQSSQNSTAGRRQSTVSLSSPVKAQHHGLVGGLDEKIGTTESKNSGARHRSAGTQLPNTALPIVSLPGPTPSSAGGGKSIAGPSIINKQLLSKLNKSLKEKQKVTNAREPQAKNPAMIQNVLSASPKMSGNLNSTLMDHNNNLTPAPDDPSTLNSKDTDLLSVTSSSQNPGKDAIKSKSKSKGKRISKQNSTRTDFFAAKLASAVDDVESSDSDETFVYETNADRFENDGSADDVDLVVSSIGVNSSPQAVKGAEFSSQSEFINHAPTSMHVVNDNISVAGSLRNFPHDNNSYVPSGELGKDEEKDLSSHILNLPAFAAESINSLQSSKPNPRNFLQATSVTTTTPTSTNNGKPSSSSGPSHPMDYSAFSDPFLESSTRGQRQPTRKSSTHSILSEERNDYLLRSPHSPYGMTKHAVNSIPHGISEHSHSSSRPYQEGLYSYGEECHSGDDASSHGDVHSTSTERNVLASSNMNAMKGDHFEANYSSRSKKPSSTSSKLRSTTSKLFDKKGAQPRRYSTIPDDVDIEDFDDELIYYDHNNMRFPHYNANGSLNESTSLLNGHKLPHHRSLNLNFTSKRAAANPRNTRYVSLGYAPPISYQNFKKNNDIFPFPYPDGTQKSFYGFDEYEEEAQMSPDNLTTPMHYQGKNSPSPHHTRFNFLRKLPQDQNGNDKVKLVKSVIYTLIGIIFILSVGFVSGFLLASTKELTNVSILSIDHATVSKDELIFNVVIEALNPGWLTVSLDEMELDVFAKSGYLGEESTSSSVETVLLGSVSNFESAVYFEGNFLNRQTSQQTGEIKLLGPGKNFTGSQAEFPKMSISSSGMKRNYSRDPSDPHTPPDNSEKWAKISQHPFDLILRGVIKYNLPWTNNVKSVVVNKVGYIDPSQTF